MALIGSLFGSGDSQQEAQRKMVRDYIFQKIQSKIQADQNSKPLNVDRILGIPGQNELNQQKDQAVKALFNQPSIGPLPQEQGAMLAQAQDQTPRQISELRTKFNVPEGVGKLTIDQYKDFTAARKSDNEINKTPKDPLDELLSAENLIAFNKPAGTKWRDVLGQTPKNQRQESLNAEREQRRMDQYNKNKADVIAKFNADPSSKKAQQSIDAVNTIQELASSGNPIGAAAIPTFMARASGEVGNLSEADKRPFGGSNAILQRLNAAVTQMATGQLTPDNQKFIIDITNTIQNRAKQNMENLAKKYSKQYGKLDNYGTPEEIFSILSTDAGDSGKNEVKRKTKDGRVAIFDGTTKQFLRYE